MARTLLSLWIFSIFWGLPGLSRGEGPGIADPLEMLWSGELHLASDGSPLVPVRLDAGKSSFELVPRGEAVLKAGKRHVAARPGVALIASVREGKPAVLAHRVAVEEVPFGDAAAAATAVARWKERGLAAGSLVIGSRHQVGERVFDNRSHVILVGPQGGLPEAEALIADVAGRFSEVQPRIFSELLRRPTGIVEVRDEKGRLLASSRGLLILEAGAILLKHVEHSHGYANHGREDRLYKGPIHLTVGSDGRIAAVNVLPIEELIRGIVPSEIYATAPLEALKAQAVTARGEVLAKIGARHRTDPWAICAEQHCQVYKGLSGAHPRTDEAIDLSRGQYLFSPAGKLVDSVFSSTCGGHTENNEAVWGTPPDPSLRGVPDWVASEGEQPGLQGKVADVAAFLSLEVAGMCGAGSFSRADKYRWERRFSEDEMNTIGTRLGVGRIRGLEVTGRGVSGRATGLAFRGEKGNRIVRGELNIRRLLGNLNSSLFVVAKQEGAWTFRGAGWGHGVGMCQTGAIGRAERGHDYRAILRHYYNGAEPVTLH